MKFLTRVYQSLNRSKQRETLYHLRNMTDRQLIDCGFSPYLVSEGLKAWPWRFDISTPESPVLERIHIDEQSLARDLQSYSDSDLADLGITRGSIADDIENGRPGIERIRANEAA